MSDLAPLDDWPEPDAVVSDAVVIRADIYRRLTTPAGAHEAIGQIAHRTLDVRGLLESATAGEWSRWEDACREALLDDDRLEAVAVTIAGVAGRAISLDVTASLAIGGTIRVPIELGALP